MPRESNVCSWLSSEQVKMNTQDNQDWLKESGFFQWNKNKNELIVSLHDEYIAMQIRESIIKWIHQK